MEAETQAATAEDQRGPGHLGRWRAQMVKEGPTLSSSGLFHLWQRDGHSKEFLPVIKTAFKEQELFVT